MGNNTSQIRRSSVTYNESNVRRSTTSSQRPDHQNLDEEFSDLILHEVKKDQDIRQQNLFNQSVAVPESLNRHPSLKYNQFSNDLIEDEFNELKDLIETDEAELTRNIIPNDKDVHKDDDDDDMIGVDENDTTLVVNNHNEVDDNMDVDYANHASGSTTVETVTPDLSSVDFTKIVANASPGAAARSPVGGYRSKPTVQPMTINSSGSTTNSHGGIVDVNSNGIVPVEIKWVNVLKENIQKVSIIGSFSNWRNIIRLKPLPHLPNEYVVTIRLPLGVHKLLYIINNEYRVSDQLPTATDSEGIFFNWFEVLDGSHLFNHSQNQPDRIVSASTKYDANIIQSAGQHEIGEIQRKSHSFLTKISKEDHPNVEHLEYREDPYEADEMQQEMQKELLQQNPSAHVPASVHSSSPDKNHHPNEPYILMSDNNSSSFLLQQRTNNQIEYSGEIPEIFVNYSYFKSQNSNFELPEPPQLPAHLNNVLLNKLSNHNNSNTQLPAHNTSYPPHTHNYSSDNGTMPQLDTFKPPSASFMGESSSSKRPPLRRADSSYYASNQEAYHLSIPNHVILNHLMTTSIRNDVLTVACITRYSGKFVTQIMHSPADSLSGES